MDAPNDPERSPAPLSAVAPDQWLIADIVIGLLILNSASALIAAIWIYVSIRLAALVIIFGAFGLLVFAARRPRLGTMFLFFFILSGFEAVVLEEYIVATFGGEERDVRVEDAIKYHTSSVFTFADGALRIDMAGRSSMATKAGDTRQGVSYSYVVPFVQDGWTEKMPVNVLATCNITKAGVLGASRSVIRECGDFGTGSPKAVAVPESGFFRAIDDAVARHDLKVDENALLVEFVDDPAEYIRGKQRWAVRFPIVLNALFVVAIVVTGVVMGRKRKG